MYEGSYLCERRSFKNFMDYFKENPKDALASCKGAALIFGGGHLTAEEAYELNKNYAKGGDTKQFYMFTPGCHNHLGHAVINLDTKTDPDFIADYTEKGIIQKLKLGEHNLVGRFDEVMFENVRASTSYFSSSALENAYEALKPNGRVVIISDVPLFIVGEFFYRDSAPQILSNIGFYNIQTVNGYFDILTGRFLNGPVTIAYKPAQNETLNTKKK
ncbi:MAG: hypothetical protein BGO77_06895 [Caedibacter sp. 37-49]|nr:MAG: hypothetical protein BGO77_06895 [Caedibacter sp. 37-49]